MTREEAIALLDAPCCRPDGAAWFTFGSSVRFYAPGCYTSWDDEAPRYTLSIALFPAPPSWREEHDWGVWLRLRLDTARPENVAVEFDPPHDPEVLWSFPRGAPGAPVAADDPGVRAALACLPGGLAGAVQRLLDLVGRYPEDYDALDGAFAYESGERIGPRPQTGATSCAAVCDFSPDATKLEARRYEAREVLRTT